MTKEIKTSTRSIYDLLKKIIKSVLSVEDYYSERGTIKSVNINDRTCIVTLIGGGELTDVKLQATAESNKGILVEPKTDTPCIVTFMGRGDAYLSMIDEVENYYLNAGSDITFNDGDNEGLINISELTSKLNNLKTEINSLITSYNSHIHVTTATISATPVVGVISPTTSQASSVSSFNKSDYEDTNVKH